ncbi:MAG: hypothetical protein ACRC42_00675, partial [Mycoplasma sp.]
PIKVSHYIINDPAYYNTRDCSGDTISGITFISAPLVVSIHFKIEPWIVAGQLIAVCGTDCKATPKDVINGAQYSCIELTISALGDYSITSLSLKDNSSLIFDITSLTKAPIKVSNYIISDPVYYRNYYCKGDSISAITITPGPLPISIHFKIAPWIKTGILITECGKYPLCEVSSPVLQDAESACSHFLINEVGDYSITSLSLQDDPTAIFDITSLTKTPIKVSHYIISDPAYYNTRDCSGDTISGITFISAPLVVSIHFKIEPSIVTGQLIAVCGTDCKATPKDVIHGAQYSCIELTISAMGDYSITSLSLKDNSSLIFDITLLTKAPIKVSNYIISNPVYYSKSDCSGDTITSTKLNIGKADVSIHFTIAPGIVAGQLIAVCGTDCEATPTDVNQGAQSSCIKLTISKVGDYSIKSLSLKDDSTKTFEIKALIDKIIKIEASEYLISDPVYYSKSDCSGDTITSTKLNIGKADVSIHFTIAPGIVAGQLITVCGTDCEATPTDVNQGAQSSCIKLTISKVGEYSIKSLSLKTATTKTFDITALIAKEIKIEASDYLISDPVYYSKSDC